MTGELLLDNKKRENGAHGDDDVDAAEGPVYDQVPLEERLSQIAGESPLALSFFTFDESSLSDSKIYIRKLQAEC